MNPGAATDADSLRAAYLVEVARTLYPAADGAAGDGEGTTEYLVVPHARSPRLLVPAAPRRVAAAAVRRYAEPQSALAAAKRGLVVAAVRGGAAGLLLRDRLRVPVAGSIESHLRRRLGQELLLSIHIGPARANRKAVLQLLRPDGQTVGFAKVGTGSLTRALVRAETDALRTLAGVGLRQVTLPEVWHAGRWQGHEVLVQSALPVWRPRTALLPDRLAAAMREVATCQGVTSAPLSDSGYWARLRRRVAAVADQPDGATLATAVDRLGEHSGTIPVRFGAWHGDWTRWNMATLADTLLVWDWERFATDVPLGFDAVHFALQQGVHGSADPAAVVDRTLRRVDELLAPFDVPPEGRELTGLLYLMDLAARYLTDRQAEAGSRLGALGTWLLPVLVRRVGTTRTPT